MKTKHTYGSFDQHNELKALQYTIDECQRVMDEITQTDFIGNRDQEYGKCYRIQARAQKRIRTIINEEL